MHYLDSKGEEKKLADIEREILWGIFEKNAVHPFKTSIKNDDKWAKEEQLDYDRQHTPMKSEGWKNAILSCGIENIFYIDTQKGNRNNEIQTYGISNKDGNFIVNFVFSEQSWNGDKNGYMHLVGINAEKINNNLSLNNKDMAKLNKEQVKDLQKRIEEKGKKARSKWAKSVCEDASSLLEDVLEWMEVDDLKEVEINEKLLLNNAKSWEDYSNGGNAYAYDTDIAEHYLTKSELKRVGYDEKNGSVNERPSERETWLELQARALRQAWWLIRDELNGTTEFSMSLFNFSYQDVEGHYAGTENFKVIENNKDRLVLETDTMRSVWTFDGNNVVKYETTDKTSGNKIESKDSTSYFKKSQGLTEEYNGNEKIATFKTPKRTYTYDFKVGKLIDEKGNPANAKDMGKLLSNESSEVCDNIRKSVNQIEDELKKYGHLKMAKKDEVFATIKDSLTKTNFDMDNTLDEYFDLLVDYGIATEDELRLVISINGYTGKTLNDVLFARTGYRSWENYCEANDIEIEEDDDDDKEFSMKSNFEIIDGMVLEIYDKNGNLANTITDERSLRRNLTEILWAKAQKMGKSVKIGRTYYDKNGQARCDIKQTFNDGGVYLLKGVPTTWGYIDTMKIGFSIVEDFRKSANKIDKKFECGILMF